MLQKLLVSVFLCVAILLSCCQVANCQGNSRSVRLNPYTMNYIKQMLSRNGQKVSNRPSISTNSKYPNLSLQPLKASSKLTIQPLGVKPLLVKPVYGKTFLNVGKNKGGNTNLGQAGQYTFAQVQQQKSANSVGGKKVNPIMVALPNLGNLLYKYAKKQVANRQTPVYNQNLYHMFGRQTYGPMPVPSGNTAGTYGSNRATQQQQPKQVQQGYVSRSQPSAPVKAVSISSSRSLGYNNPVVMMPSPNSLYQKPVVPPSASKQMSYSSLAAAGGGHGNIHIGGGYGQGQSSSHGSIKIGSGYGQGQSLSQGNIHIGGGYGQGMSPDWGGMLYISGPAEELVNIVQPSITNSISSYNPPVTQTGYGQTVKQVTTSKKKSSIGAGTTCYPVPTNFCLSRKPGHFTSPGSRHCFIQCDAFGRGYNKECAPGTTWNVRGPEPALFNMCS